MKIIVLIVVINLLASAQNFAQTNQQKAQDLVVSYLKNRSKLKSKQNIKFDRIEILRSSFTDTKPYKNYQHKIDSLKVAGRKIDARIAKMKTAAELNQAKKDSNWLSRELVATSDELIEFMTSYKGKPVGWQIRIANSSRLRSKKNYYINQELTKIDSVK